MGPLGPTENALSGICNILRMRSLQSPESVRPPTSTAFREKDFLSTVLAVSKSVNPKQIFLLKNMPIFVFSHMHIFVVLSFRRL